MVSNSNARRGRPRGTEPAVVVRPALRLAGDTQSAADAAARVAAGSDQHGAAQHGADQQGADSTEALLLRYRRLGAHTRTARLLMGRVVERYRGSVEAMAAALAARLPPSVDAQDLVHAGIWGLMQAIDSYDPARCDQFSAFMRIRVRGAMLDELRNLDFLPRLFRRRLRERNEARARLRMELEREPTGSELASALGITEQALLRRCEPALLRQTMDSDAEGEGHCEQLADEGLESPLEAITRQELLDQVRDALDPIEWRVLQLHYLEGLTGKQVARKLRLSASRICQIHGRVLDRLKARLGGEATV